MNLEFSFDRFMKMAADDPDAFEKYREILLKQAIEDTSPQIQQKLEDLQRRIDMECEATGSPMGSCVRVFDLMVDYFYAEYLLVAYIGTPVKKSTKLRTVR